MGARLIRDDLLDSERVLNCTPEARWLYVAILLQADDVGLFEATPFKLARKADLNRDRADQMLAELVAQDLIRLYKHAGKQYGFVPRFKQRLQIKRAKYPLPPTDILHDDDDALKKIKHLTANPTVDHRDSTVGHGDSPPEPEPEPEDKTDPSLRSGSATTPPKGGDGSPTKAKRKRAPAGEKSPAALAFDAYSAAYLARYKVAPLSNAMVRGQMANFLARVPAADAPAIAAFYVGHKGNLYVAAKHPVNLLLRDCERLSSDWATNQRAEPARAIAEQTETAFQRSRRESVERMTGGMVSKPAPPTTKEIFDDVPDAPRIGH